MADNFFKTAERMCDSSKILHEQKQFHISCYLAGYVAECYLKILVSKTPSITKPLFGKGGYSHDINKLNTDLYTDLQYFLTCGTVTPSLSRSHFLDMSSECPKIYNTWNPNKRYDDSSGWDNLLDSQIFQTEKDKCFDKIADMFVSNLIP